MKQSALLTALRTLTSAAALVVLLSPAAAAPDAPPPSAPRDPRIDAVLADISAARIEHDIATLVGFGTRHTLSETASDTRGIGAARRWILGELQACAARPGARLKVEAQPFTQPAGVRVSAPIELVNLVATLPGTAPAAKDRLLVVSGHYDSRVSDVMNATADAPGADDDGSGTAAVIAMACAMATSSFDATIVFLAVPGEEQGLYGSEHWAAEAARQGLDVEAMITNDIVGTPRADGGRARPGEPRVLRLFADGLDPLLRQYAGHGQLDAAAQARLQQLALGGGAADLPTQQLARAIAAAARRYVPAIELHVIQRRDRYLRGGDHIPFLARGWAAVRLTEPYENFDHQHQDLRREGTRVYGDLPEYVDPDYVADVARVNAAALATLALAPAAPREVRIDARELDTGTTLRWQRDADAAGYRIVWRVPGEPDWTHGVDVGAVDHARLEVSKDDVVFGVEALSRSGEPSLASFPLPQSR